MSMFVKIMQRDMKFSCLYVTSLSATAKSEPGGKAVPQKRKSQFNLSFIQHERKDAVTSCTVYTGYDGCYDLRVG
jgi:hypothetical protein